MNYFVECDDQLHRIFHLPVPTHSTHGFDMFETSQWWIISRDFAHYLAAAEPDTFVHQFLPYIQHVVVADENFFGTVLRNTEFCLTHVNRNYLHMEFDRWESDVPQSQRDPRKCMMKDPNHCGRSPTTLTLEDAPILELSDNLFARKVRLSFVLVQMSNYWLLVCLSYFDCRLLLFQLDGDSELKDLVDQWRQQREEDIREYLKDPEHSRKLRSRFDVEFEGHGVLIVAKHTVQDATPLCLGLGDVGNVVRLVPCFHDWVPSNLLPGWETGSVLEIEVRLQNRWELAPCTSNGHMKRDPLTGGMSLTSDSSTVAGVQGPLCMLKQLGGGKQR